MRLERTSHSEADTRRIAGALARALAAGDCLALRGELGAGKTCFVRGLAEALGIDPARISSPTFVLLHEHERPDGPALAHIDAYRLTGPEDAETLALEELLESAICAIEWPDRLGDLLPERRIDISLDHAAGDRRRITIAAPADRLAHLIELAS
jgi:tRNA threonylcarbamoyladenosine biosynthesis protein TsaE